MKKAPEHIPDASGLGTLYPTAKTADEIHRDNLERQKMLDSRLPKFFRLKIALSTSLAFAFLLSFSINMEWMWGTGDTGTVFQSFGLGLVLAFVVWLCVRYMSKVFYAYGWSPRVFGFSYAGAVFTLYALGLYGFFGNLHNLLNLSIAASVHFAATLVLLFVLVRGGK